MKFEGRSAAGSATRPRGRPRLLVAAISLLMLAPSGASSQPPPADRFDQAVSTYRRLWSDPALEARIVDGIERNRKSTVAVSVVDRNGRPLEGARVRLVQQSHAFIFGGNGFMVGGFDDAARNALWERRFAHLFNSTTVPFYWRDFEPQPGVYRTGEDSVAIYRRPPPDRVLSFARRWGLDVKGHVMVWNQPDISQPSYWPRDQALQRDMIARRIAWLGKSYAQTINTWDVVNEVVHSATRFDAASMPPDYPFVALGDAARAFPPSAKLLVNEAAPEAWDQYAGESTPFFLLLGNLMARGARIDAIGLQMHFFSEQEVDDALSGKHRSPELMFKALDLYARLHRPIAITEITIPTLSNYGGEAFQAEMARNMYRLWFSHPAVTNIVWWNLADGTAFRGEDRWNGGLVDKANLAPKAAYRALDQLINRDWRSDVRVTTDASGQTTARVFHGTYRVEVEHVRGRWQAAATVSPGARQSLRLAMPAR